MASPAPPLLTAKYLSLPLMSRPFISAVMLGPWPALLGSAAVLCVVTRGGRVMLALTSLPAMNLAYWSVQLFCIPFGVIAMVDGGAPIAAVRRDSAVALEVEFSLAGPLLM